MNQLFKNTIVAVALPFIFLGVPASAMISNSGIDNDGDTRRVGNVIWTNQTDADINNILAEKVDTNQTRLIFIRKNDNNSEQTSANIAVDNRFQVSLHAGNYTSVNSCLGIKQLSAHATGFKNNNLLADKKIYEMVGGQTYFFYIDMDKKEEDTLEQVTPARAAQLLTNKRYQTHQISRVVPNCPAPVAALPPVTVPLIVKPTPILTEKMTIDLEVLFETDKATVRPEYYSRVSEVAEFMMQYPNTIATIEGHTDNRNSDGYNQVLSQRRVNAVKGLLVTHFGVAPERLDAVGYGELQPRATNDNAEGRQRNRRVVAVVEERLGN